LSIAMKYEPIASVGGWFDLVGSNMRIAAPRRNRRHLAVALRFVIA